MNRKVWKKKESWICLSISNPITDLSRKNNPWTNQPELDRPVSHLRFYIWSWKVLEFCYFLHPSYRSLRLQVGYNGCYFSIVLSCARKCRHAQVTVYVGGAPILVRKLYNIMKIRLDNILVWHVLPKWRAAPILLLVRQGDVNTRHLQSQEQTSWHFFFWHFSWTSQFDSWRHLYDWALPPSIFMHILQGVNSVERPHMVDPFGSSSSCTILYNIVRNLVKKALPSNSSRSK